VTEKIPNSKSQSPNHDRPLWLEAVYGRPANNSSGKVAFRGPVSGKNEKHPEAWQPLVEAVRDRDITLVFGKRDPEHNNAVALRSFLQKKAGAVRSRAKSRSARC
jgi:hypothetical protein